jgi:hypothetical protein
MERNRAATYMIDKEFLAICNFYIIFIISSLIVFCETFCTAISMIGEEEILVICYFYIVFVIFYFIIFYEIFTIDQQLNRYRMGDRCAFITVGVKFFFILG